LWRGWHEERKVPPASVSGQGLPLASWHGQQEEWLRPLGSWTGRPPVLCVVGVSITSLSKKHLYLLNFSRYQKAKNTFAINFSLSPTFVK
jgi:hypothetical protein